MNNSTDTAYAVDKTAFLAFWYFFYFLLTLCMFEIGLMLLNRILRSIRECYEISNTPLEKNPIDDKPPPYEV